MKTRAFNLVDLGKDDSDILFNIEGEQKMQDEKPKKKKIKFNFDHLFPRPKGTEKDMGMGNICDGEPFEGLF